VVELSGGLPPDHVLTASSTPSLSEDEIKSLLAFGRSQPGERAAGGQQASSDDLLASLVGRQLLETVLGPLEQEVSSALGLSEFSLQVGVNEPVEFRVGKYIVKGLLLSYRRTSGGPRDQYDLNLSYEVRPKVTVTLHTDERSEKDLRVQYRWTF
jgi:autotransporter translocation and assembly factor TamB